MIKAVLFDLDGTLYNSERLTQATQELAYKLLANIEKTSVENVRKTVQKLMGTSLTFTKTVENLGLSPQFWYEELSKRIEPCQFIESDERNVQLVAKLEKRGLKKGVVTNSGRPWAIKVLSALGFPIDSFDVLVTSSEAEPKPSTESYALAVRLLDLKPYEVVYVGDRIIELKPAKKTGLRTILVSSDGIRRRWADYAVKSIYELPELLDNLSPANAHPLVLKLSKQNLLEGKASFLDRSLYLSQMKEEYSDKKAITKLLKQGDVLIFKGRKPILPLNRDWLNFSVRSLQYGGIGSEFVMEPGHIHDTTAEIYIGLSGRGKMLLEYAEKQEIVDFEADVVIFLPPRCGHKLVNTGNEELKYICIYPSTAKSSSFNFHSKINNSYVSHHPLLIEHKPSNDLRTQLRRLAMDMGVSVVDAVVKILKENSLVTGKRSTLLAISPNSEAVIKAAIMAAKQADAPLMFTATLNQVDLDGGYTGWTPKLFVKVVKSLLRELQFDGPCLIALDHGGPWLKDIQRKEEWPFDKAMNALKASLIACLEAGYSMFHIDPTVDITLKDDETLSVETIVQRVVELIKYVESCRRARKMPPVAYEVGTEEVCGGLADLSFFKEFLKLLKTRLTQKGLGYIWPSFIVARIGTDLHTSFFDPQTATRVVNIAEKHGSLIKGHYTDWVSHPEKYPLVGIGGANVGPEFTVAEYDALQELVQEENKLKKEGRIKEQSNLQKALVQAVLDSGRWTKWLHADEVGNSFGELDKERREWLVKTGCRYIWSNPAVVKAREVLYRELFKNGIDPDEYVLNRIASVMEKYFRAFNLQNTNTVFRGAIIHATQPPPFVLGHA